MTDLQGWVFARYLERDEPAPRKAAAGPTQAQLRSLASKKTLQLAKHDGSALTIYAFADDKLPVAGYSRPGIETVEGLGSCIRDWCYVRSGEVAGWMKAEAFAPQDAGAEQGTTAALAQTVTLEESKTLNKTEATATSRCRPGQRRREPPRRS